MTKKELWLKLFTENDVALASAIHMCEKFIDKNISDKEREFIKEKVKELDKCMTKEQIENVFGNVN